MCGRDATCLLLVVLAAQHPECVETPVFVNPLAHGWRSAPFGELVSRREAERLVFGDARDADPSRALMTVLFTDAVGSTEQAAWLGDARWRELLVMHERMLRREVRSAGGRVVKLIGDGSLCTFDAPARAIRCAQRVCAAGRELGLEIRAELHTGECELINEDVAGIAVHIAARVSAHADAGEVLVSRTVRDLVSGSGISLGPRGEHELKGVPGKWELFAVGDKTVPASCPGPDSQVASDRPVGAARGAPCTGLLRAASRFGPQGARLETQARPRGIPQQTVTSSLVKLVSCS